MTDDAFLIKLVDWAKARPDIAALILTGSRARPSGSVDFFSDYDLEIFTTDSERYTSDSDWMKEIGDVWVFLPTESSPGFPTRLVIFDSGRKVDFSVKSPHALEAAANATEPSELYEQGYRVLMDKRGLATRLAPPSYAPPTRSTPTEEEFRTTIEEFGSKRGTFRNTCTEMIFGSSSIAIGR
jgi:aminoglycoside 6-adenylyltransferase